MNQLTERPSNSGGDPLLALTQPAAAQAPLTPTPSTPNACGHPAITSCPSAPSRAGPCQRLPDFLGVSPSTLHPSHYTFPLFCLRTSSKATAGTAPNQTSRSPQRAKDKLSHRSLHTACAFTTPGVARMSPAGDWISQLQCTQTRGHNISAVRASRGRSGHCRGRDGDSKGDRGF